MIVHRSERSRIGPAGPRIRRAAIASILLACAVAARCSSGDGGARFFGPADPQGPSENPPPSWTANPYGVRNFTVGAYYYSWWKPDEWSEGITGEPRIGRYMSDDPIAAGVHITDAKQAGIDVFALEWFAADSDSVIQRGFLQAPNLGEMQFCIFYDVPIRFGLIELTLDLDKPIPRLAFLRDMSFLAQTYMNHPQYFRIEGRPVIVIYLSRIIGGDLPGVIDSVRSDLAALGLDPYIVGDEVATGDADPNRLAAFDAVTTYNLYSAEVVSSLGITSLAGWTEFIRPIYQSWSKRAQEIRVRGSRHRLDFHPGAIPQYNDSIIRPENPPIPATAPDEFQGMLEMCKTTALPVGDSDTGMIWITSWNEWHEGTTIEPSSDGDGVPGNGYYSFGFLDAVRAVFGTP